MFKYDSSGRVSFPSATPCTSPRDHFDYSVNAARPLTSALRAGWICFGFGVLLSWCFPLGNGFFSIAIITAIVAMCTHQVNRGLVLLVSSFFAIGLCAIIFFTIVMGTVAVATGAALKKSQARLQPMKQTQAQQFQQLNNAAASLQNTLQATANQVSRRSMPITLPDSADDRQKRYELAVAQQREADARKAADDAQRARNVYAAERNRDAVTAKEQRLQQVQNAIDSNDRLIRQINGYNGNPKYFQDQRDALLKEKAKLQGY